MNIRRNLRQNVLAMLIVLCFGYPAFVRRSTEPRHEGSTNKYIVSPGRWIQHSNLDSLDGTVLQDTLAIVGFNFVSESGGETRQHGCST